MHLAVHDMPEFSFDHIENLEFMKMRLPLVPGWKKYLDDFRPGATKIGLFNENFDPSRPVLAIPLKLPGTGR